MKSLLVFGAVVLCTGLVEARPSRHFGNHQNRWHHNRGYVHWWQGPNVCVSRAGNVTSDFQNLFGGGRDFFGSMPSFFGPGPLPYQQRGRYRRSPFSRSWSSYCHDHHSHFRRCTSRLTASGNLRVSEVTHECCYGYGRKEGEPGCPVEIDLKPLPRTLADVGAEEFLDLVEVAGLHKTLRNGNNYTIFAPFDDVMQGADLNLVNELIVDGESDDWQTTVESHIVAGPRRTSDMKDEEILTTLNNRTIRLGYYPNSGPELIVTANCARVVKPNNFATNGVVHVIDDTMKSTTKSVSEIIENDPQFSILKTAMAQVGNLQKLKDKTQLTLFAPTDGAFKKLGPKLFNALIQDSDCLTALLDNHLVPHTICSAAITSYHYVTTQLGTELNVNRTSDDKLFIGDAQLVAKDIVASNGVIHTIDAVLVPKEARQLPYLLEGSLFDLIEEADLLYLLQNTKNVTLFAPTEEAIQNLSQDVKNALQESSVLRQVLMHHVVPQSLTSRDLVRDNDHKVTSMDGNDLRIDTCQRPLFRFDRPQGLTVDCVPVVQSDILGCNGVIHKIDKVLMPPSGNILEIIKADSNFSTLLRAIEVAGLAEVLDGDGALTVFAPSNEAFEELPEEYLERVLNDPNTLRGVISHHIVEDVHCGMKLLRGTWWYPMYMTTLSEDQIRVYDGSRGLIVDSATITKTDTMATNGVIHVVDKVLFAY